MAPWGSSLVVGMTFVESNVVQASRLWLELQNIVLILYAKWMTLMLPNIIAINNFSYNNQS